MSLTKIINADNLTNGLITIAQINAVVFFNKLF